MASGIYMDAIYKKSTFGLVLLNDIFIFYGNVMERDFSDDSQHRFR